MGQLGNQQIDDYLSVSTYGGGNAICLATALLPVIKRW